MSNKQKVFLPMALMSLVALSVACHKNPVEPEHIPSNPDVPTDTITPVNPNDTITPVNPNDTITPVNPNDTVLPAGGKVAYFYYEGGNDFPPLDSIRRYAFDPEYDTVYILWHAITADYWTPIGFHAARDSLSKRFKISPKVCGRLWIIPHQILPDCDSTNIGVKGMIRQDSAWYADKHYIVLPIISGKDAKPSQPTHYNGSRVLKAGRSR